MEKIPPNLAGSGAIEIAKKLKLISGGNILDIGSGDGDSIQFLIDFLKSYDSIVGIDTDEQEIKKAQRRFKNKLITCKLMNGEKIEFSDKMFDLVNIAFSLHHLQNLNETLSEMKRVLKEGGYFIIQEMFCNGNQTNSQKCDTIVHQFGAEIDRKLGNYHRKEFTKEEILNVISKLKLKDLNILESSRYPKCLKCPEKYNCEDPKFPSIIKSTLEGIDRNLERIKGHKKFPELKERAETIKKKIKKYGISSASILFCIGRKKY